MSGGGGAAIRTSARGGLRHAPAFAPGAEPENEDGVDAANCDAEVLALQASARGGTRTPPPASALPALTPTCSPVKVLPALSLLALEGRPMQLKCGMFSRYQRGGGRGFVHIHVVPLSI